MSSGDKKPKKPSRSGNGAENSGGAPPQQVTQEYLFNLTGTPENAAPGADANTGESSEKTSTIPLPSQRGPLSRMMDSNFLQFASYTICHRAIPAVEDGLKPVQRRILHALYEMDDGRFIKVANVVGHTMQYHPHGDASIGDALVNLVNKRYLIEGQGNFGNVLTGDSAAAPRYIECRLTELARKEVFNPKTTAYIDSYDGRNREPLLLPSKLPLTLMLGAEGIAVGLSTNILPHNLIELLEAQIAIIRKKPFEIFPDFQAGGRMDISEYHDGVGRVKLRARIKPRQKNRLVITEIPGSLTTESLIASIEDGIRRKKLPIRAINDYTAENVEIELVLSQNTSQEKATKALYAFSNCETTESSRIVVLRENRPCEMTVSEVLRNNTEQLLELLRRELEIRQGELMEAFHHKTLVQIFVEERIYKRIEQCTTFEAVRQAVLDGFGPFRDRLRRDVTREDVDMLLEIRIRRISLFDIQKNRQDIEKILRELDEVQANLKSLKSYAIKYLKNLIKSYRASYPRKTEIESFGKIEVRSLTASELTLRIDLENGYLGHGIKNGEDLFKCSSLDKLILVWDSGLYRVIPPPEKIFVDQNMIYCAVNDRAQLFTVVYTQPDYGFSYIKRFTFGGSILNRDYRCAPEGSKIILFEKNTPESIFVKYKPSKGQRIHQQKFFPEEVAVKGVKARGVQLTSKAIARITTEKPRGWKDNDNTPDGIFL